MNFIEKISKFKLPFFTPMTLCFDMGTSNTRIGVLGKGITLNEPTFIGINTKDKSYIFFGQEAKMIVGKTPEFLKVARPVIHGVVSDFDAQVALIKKFIEKSVSPYLNSYKIIKPPLRAFASVPHIATEIERKAVEEVLYKLGLSEVFLLEKSLVIGSALKMNIFSHKPRLIVDLGGGLIELAIISGGGIVAEKTLRNGGENMSHVLANYIYLKYGIILGENTCEEIKLSLLNFVNLDKTMIVRGKSLEDGLPKSVRIKSSDVKEALLNNFIQIVDAIKELIEISPPEVVDEIYKSGITLTGGIASVAGLDRYFAQELKIDVIVPENGASATISGLLNLGKNEQEIMKICIPKI